MQKTDVVETNYDFAGKYTSGNAVSRYLIEQFYSSINRLVEQTSPHNALEVGCGEGFSTGRLKAMLAPNVAFEASDVERRLVAAARARNGGITVSEESIYELSRPDAAFDLVFALEVLEHLEEPERALAELARIARKWVILSVPREPLWCSLNLARGKYLSSFGNTPGHLQRWSASGFTRFVSQHLEVKARLTPVPWTMLLCEVRR